MVDELINGWSTYQRLVLSDIRELKTAVHDMNDSVNKIRTELALLKLKVALLGGGAGIGGFAASKIVESLIGG